MKTARVDGWRSWTWKVDEESTQLQKHIWSREKAASGFKAVDEKGETRDENAADNDSSSWENRTSCGRWLPYASMRAHVKALKRRSFHEFFNINSRHYAVTQVLTTTSELCRGIFPSQDWGKLKLRVLRWRLTDFARQKQSQNSLSKRLRPRKLSWTSKKQFISSLEVGVCRSLRHDAPLSNRW